MKRRRTTNLTFPCQWPPKGVGVVTVWGLLGGSKGALRDHRATAKSHAQKVPLSQRATHSRWQLNLAHFPEIWNSVEFSLKGVHKASCGLTLKQDEARKYVI